MYNKKVCILGAGGVGKSSLIQRFLSGVFDEACQTNVGAKIDKIVVDVDRDKVQLMLWDIQGEDRVSPGFLNYLKGASAIIYVVDGTRLETLVTAMEYRQETEKYFGCARPSMMLFNKSDLAKQWEISSVMISDVETVGLFAMLTSCLEGSGVHTAFNLITRIMMGKTALMPVMTMPPSLGNDDAGMQSRF